MAVTPTFDGLDLTTLGLVDLRSQYAPPPVVLQLAESEAPGVSGSRLLLGGVRAQTLTLPIRLRGTGGSQSVAESSMRSHLVKLTGLVGETGTLEDPYGIAWPDTTLVAIQYIPGQRYSREGVTWVLSRDVVLAFKRTLSEEDPGPE